MSGGYSSKLEVSIVLRICGMIGGVFVRERSPSQLNPSNHLQVEKAKKTSVIEHAF